MNTPTQTLLSDIEAFLAKSGMAPSEFGKAAIHDPNLVRNLRDGRELRFNTVKRVRSFMQRQKSMVAA
jgi:hypothetical protein